MLEISVREVKEKLDRDEPIHLLDVREPHEVDFCALPGAEHISILELFTGLKKTSAAQDAEVVVYCHSGIRSMEAAMFLRHQGFANAKSMAGGIDAWSAEIDPTVPRY